LRSIRYPQFGFPTTGRPPSRHETDALPLLHGRRSGGPFVHVSLAGSTGERSVAGQVAQIDTGAYKTVIPEALVSRLGRVTLRQVAAEGLDGALGVYSTVVVDLTIHELSTVRLEVLVAEGEPCVLLGRDLLNRYRITLDGPNQALTIEEP
jgi:hypothetical protein